MDPEIKRKIDQVKIDLMDEDSGTVFFSSLLTQLKIVLDESMDTAWTDAVSIGINPDLIKRATVDELIGVFMHELGHVIFDHIAIAFENQEWIDHDLHNQAGDHHINLRNKARGYVLPHWIEPLQDPKYAGMSTMQIYQDLLKQKKNGNHKPPPSNGMGSDVRIPEGMTPTEHKEHVISAIVKATMQTEMMGEKAAGSVPGHVKRIVEEVTSPKLPWYTILEQYLTAYTDVDYSMRRPNRKYMPEFYLPSLIGEGFGKMLVACDVSGSISEEELGIAVNETRWVYDILKPESLRFITFDTEIHDNDVFHRGEYFPGEFSLEGGGGTIVDPVLQYALDENPEIFMIFTDGYFSPPDMSLCTGDIFWVIKGNPNFEAVQGTVIHMED